MNAPWKRYEQQLLEFAMKFPRSFPPINNSSDATLIFTFVHTTFSPLIAIECLLLQDLRSHQTLLEVLLDIQWQAWGA